MESENATDEELIQQAEDLGLLDAGGYGSPEPEKKDGIFRFFRDVLKFPESWKVGNLKDVEIGQSKLSIRSLLELGQYAEKEGLNEVADYFVERANIVGSTTMGRKGFFLQTSITNIKKEQKIREPMPEKKRWIGGKKSEA